MGFTLVDGGNETYIVSSETGESLLYVHKHYENFESSVATSYFKNKQALKDKMLNRYKTRLLQSIHIPQGAQDVFDLSDEAKLEDFFKDIDSGMILGLEESLLNMPTQLNNYSMAARKTYDPNKIQSFDNVIDIINKALKMVMGNRNALSVILNSSKGSMSKLKQDLQNELNKKNGKILGFNSSTLNKIAKDLINMISAIEGEGLSKNSFSTYISDIFSTGLGEYLIASGVQKQIGKASKKAVEALMVGTKSPHMAIKELNKGDSEEFLSNATYKPDVSAKNFQIKINEHGDTISVDLGLSVKQYSSEADHVSIVTNKPFAQAVNALFHDGKYYVYNTLGLLSEAQEQYREMKKAIILAYADNFLSGTGAGNDFAQYIVINGQPYPIYDILKKVATNTTGALSSDHDSADPVKISIAGASVFEKLKAEFDGPNNWTQAWERTKKINSVISNDLTIHGTLNLSALRP